MKLNHNAIYKGVVYHARHQPFFHDFKYRVYTLWINVDDLDQSKTKTRFFSFNKFNLLSVYNKNHGPRNGSPLRPWIEQAAAEKNIDIKDGAIYMLCFPRILSYTFSPLTVYFCYNKQGELKALLHQVKNTFGDQHGYMMPVEQDDKTIKQDCEKIFHVSPFIQMDSHYHFRVTEPDADGFHVAIHQYVDDGKILTATWDGSQAMPFTDHYLLKMFGTIPFQSLKIIVAIHWQALKLWMKGAKYVPYTSPPTKDVT